ncbi:MAG: chemotaxis protein CheV [Candidatus Omnitrophica bacterium]|nr:chemotaxis protein CheV [Candidatus Omnitrophota bacterium]
MSSEKIRLSNVLLDVGTNELEIVEFCLADSFYGINVMKVREIIRCPENIVAVPHAHPAVDGVINVRGTIIPVVNLARQFGIDDTKATKAVQRIIISQFNKLTIGFLVSSVSRIHRFSWQQVVAPSGMISNGDTYVVSMVKMDEKIILLLDFEKIAFDVSPEARPPQVEASPVKELPAAFDRSAKTILVAEDSKFLRAVMVEALSKLGYKVIATSDGEEAWQEFETHNANNAAGGVPIDLLVSDIEMPRMDGLHLVRKIKVSNGFRKVPCIVFSSMINTDLSQRCAAIGVDVTITKPEISKLVEAVEGHFNQGRA